MNSNDSNERFDYLFKIVVIGDSNVGKTNIISRLTRDQFSEDSKSTIGVGFATKTYKIGDSSIKVQLWDTAGQERYHALISAYYRGSSGAVVVYDTTNKNSLENARTSWLKNLRTAVEDGIPVMLLGNKSDLKDQRCVSKDEGEKSALSEKMLFFETSALSGDNIQAAFELFIAQIYEQQKSIEISSTKKVLDEKKVKIQKLDGKKKRNTSCC